MNSLPRRSWLTEKGFLPRLCCPSPTLKSEELLDPSERIQIFERTKGRVVGVDASDGMVEEAKRNYSHLGLTFDVCTADRLEYADSFDAIFCNSAFQWFKHPEPVLKSCYTALRLRGKMGIQAPARNVYSPNFIDAVETVGKDARLSEKFESFEAPWLLLETPEEYEILFQNAGFAVLHAHMERVVSSHTPEEVFKIFDSGASAGYLNQDFYHSPISDDYISGFREVVREAFTRQANPDGQVDLTFFRIYLLALKP